MHNLNVACIPWLVEREDQALVMRLSECGDCEPGSFDSSRGSKLELWPEIDALLSVRHLAVSRSWQLAWDLAGCGMKTKPRP